MEVKTPARLAHAAGPEEELDAAHWRGRMMPSEEEVDKRGRVAAAMSAAARSGLGVALVLGAVVALATWGALAAAGAAAGEGAAKPGVVHGGVTPPPSGETAEPVPLPGNAPDQIVGGLERFRVSPPLWEALDESEPGLWVENQEGQQEVVVIRVAPPEGTRLAGESMVWIDVDQSSATGSSGYGTTAPGGESWPAPPDGMDVFVTFEVHLSRPFFTRPPEVWAGCAPSADLGSDWRDAPCAVQLLELPAASYELENGIATLRFNASDLMTQVSESDPLEPFDELGDFGVSVALGLFPRTTPTVRPPGNQWLAAYRDWGTELERRCAAPNAVAQRAVLVAPAVDEDVRALGAVQYQLLQAGLPFDVVAAPELVNLADTCEYSLVVAPWLDEASDSLMPALRKALVKLVHVRGAALVAAGDILSRRAAPFGGASEARADEQWALQALLGLQRDLGDADVDASGTDSDTVHPVLVVDNEGTPLGNVSAGDVLLPRARAVPAFSYGPAERSAFKARVVARERRFVPSMGREIYLSRVLVSEARFNRLGLRSGSVAHFAGATLLEDVDTVWRTLQWAAALGSRPAFGMRLSRHASVLVLRHDLEEATESQTAALLDDVLGPLQTDYGLVSSAYLVDQEDEGPGAGLAAFVAAGNEIGRILAAATSPSAGDSGSPSPWNSTDDDGTYQPERNNTGEDPGAKLRAQGSAWVGPAAAMAMALADLEEGPHAPSYLSDQTPGAPGFFGFSGPGGDPAVLLGSNLVPNEADTALWAAMWDNLLARAAQAVVQWPTAPRGQQPDADVLRGAVQKASEADAEFVTAMGVHDRIRAHNAARVESSCWLLPTAGAPEDQDGDVRHFCRVRVAPGAGAGVGTLALDLLGRSDTKILSVSKWPAFSPEGRILLPVAGGEFDVMLCSICAEATEQTRVLSLPMRGEILRLEGDGTTLDLTLRGQGALRITLSPAALDADVVVTAGVGVTNEQGDEEEHLDVELLREGSIVTVLLAAGEDAIHRIKVRAASPPSVPTPSPVATVEVPTRMPTTLAPTSAATLTPTTGPTASPGEDDGRPEQETPSPTLESNPFDPSTGGPKNPALPDEPAEPEPQGLGLSASHIALIAGGASVLTAWMGLAYRRHVQRNEEARLREEARVLAARINKLL